MQIDVKSIKSNANDEIKGELNFLLLSIGNIIANLIKQIIPAIIMVIIVISMIKRTAAGAMSMEDFYFIRNIIYLATTVAVIPLQVLSIGLANFYLTFNIGGAVVYSELFCSFKEGAKIYFSHLLMLLLKSMIISLWSMLFIIPGIIKALAYSQAEYIQAENPDMTPFECLHASEAMMEGHKSELFFLQLSFLPLFILIPFTLGLITLYLIPYISLSQAKFYDMLKPRRLNKSGIGGGGIKEKTVSLPVQPKIALTPGAYVPKKKEENN